MSSEGSVFLSAADSSFGFSIIIPFTAAKAAIAAANSPPLKIKSPTGEEIFIEFDGAFVEKKLKPNTKLVSDLLDLDEQGRIVVNNQNLTSMAGVFAAGDVTNTYAEQVLVAIGEGAKAALSAYDYLLQIED